MPLLDHFQPPLYPRHRWHGFHNAWATYLAAALNQCLPAGYFATPNVQYAIEIDTAILREGTVVYDTAATLAAENGTNGAVAPSNWLPPHPSQTIDFEPINDYIEVLVYYEVGGPTLVGAIELVSPANKDRPAQRSAFTAKCEAYLRGGVGLLVIDVVSNRKANLHTALMQRLGANEQTIAEETLYAVAYHTLERNNQPQLDFWYAGLTIGQLLPTMPLWLQDGPCLPVELETVYARTCQELRIPTDLVSEGPL